MKHNLKILLTLVLCMILSCGMIVETSVPVMAKETDDYKTFLQTDPRWAGKPLGNSSWTVGNAGCAVTSVTLLMAYANPKLRDVDKFNPGSTAFTLAPYGGLEWGNSKTLDETFTLIGSFYGKEPLSTVKDALDKGQYVVVHSQGVGSMGHFSPIMGIVNGKPQIWDVGVGLYNDWDYWMARGIDQIVIYQSSLNSSKEALAGNIVSTPEGEEAEELQEEWDALTKEQELVGMTKNFSFDAKVEMTDYDSLSTQEKESLDKIKENLVEKKSTWFDKLMVVVSFIGLGVIIYGVLLGVAYVFDRVNTILEISLLAIMTLGKYKLWDETLGIEPGVTDGIMYCDNRLIIIRIFIIECIGFLLISGYIFRLFYRALTRITII